MLSGRFCQLQFRSDILIQKNPFIIYNSVQRILKRINYTLWWIVDNMHCVYICISFKKVIFWQYFLNNYFKNLNRLFWINKLNFHWQLLSSADFTLTFFRILLLKNGNVFLLSLLYFSEILCCKISFVEYASMPSLVSTKFSQ